MTLLRCVCVLAIAVVGALVVWFVGACVAEYFKPYRKG